MVTIERVDEYERQDLGGDFDIAPLGDGGLDNMSVQHFRFEPGARVPEHSHHQEQIGYVTQGELTLIVDGEEHVLGPGDAYYLRSDEPHAGENRGDEDVLGIDIFSPPRDAPNWAE